MRRGRGEEEEEKWEEEEAFDGDSDYAGRANRQ